MSKRRSTPERPQADRPVCLVTGEVNDYRVEPFRLLAESENVEVLAFRDPGPAVPGLVVRHATQRECVRLAGSGRYRAVIAGLVGRIALPGAYLAARRAGIPFVLWATMWGHPRTPMHALSFLPTAWLYRHADAIATYGPHVTSYVARFRGRRAGIFEAPQAVDGDHFGRAVGVLDRAHWRERAGARDDDVLVVFVGRLEREKGIHVLLEAWSQTNVAGRAVLAFAGTGPLAAEIARSAPWARQLGRVSRADLPALYAATDVLVLPSIQTAKTKETWGLVCNEAMHQGVPVVATALVGAAAGGLVRDGRNGLVVSAGRSAALARALKRIVDDGALRRKLGAAAREDVAAFTPRAWADGMRRALAHVGASISAGSSS